MALFTAYFDASGDASFTPDVVVSGFVANFQQWGWFQYFWEKAHREAGADLPFHMTAFMAACKDPDRYSRQKDVRADYIRIAKDPKAAKEFLYHLALSEITALSCGITCYVAMDFYNDLDSILCLHETFPAYALGARMCIEKLHQWEEKLQITEPVEYIFERGDFGQGEFSKLMVDEGENLPIYKNKNDFLGLQAADHYAWEQSNFIKNRRRDENIPATEGLAMLINSIPKLTVYPIRENVIKLCEVKGVKPRLVHRVGSI
jgi:hypothetical protein